MNDKQRMLKLEEEVAQLKRATARMLKYIDAALQEIATLQKAVLIPSKN